MVMMLIVVAFLLQDDIQDLNPEKKQKALPIFVPIYTSLMNCLLVKVQYPPDAQYEQWSPGEPPLLAPETLLELFPAHCPSFS